MKIDLKIKTTGEPGRGSRKFFTAMIKEEIVAKGFFITNKWHGCCLFVRKERELSHKEFELFRRKLLSEIEKFSGTEIKFLILENKKRDFLKRERRPFKYSFPVRIPGNRKLTDELKRLVI